jgi:hypothetical protein
MPSALMVQVLALHTNIKDQTEVKPQQHFALEL